MKNRTTNRIRGFTLIEALVYIFILVLITSVIIAIFFSLDKTLIRNKVYRDITKAAGITMERMVRDIRAAETVDLLERTLPTEIAIDSKEGTTTEFYLSGGRIFVDVNDVTQGPLTSDNVTITNLNFTHFNGAGTELESEAVRVSFTVHASSKAASSTQTFYTTAVLRESYE